MGHKTGRGQLGPIVIEVLGHLGGTYREIAEAVDLSQGSICSRIYDRRQSGPYATLMTCIAAEALRGLKSEELKAQSVRAGVRLMRSLRKRV